MKNDITRPTLICHSTQAARHARQIVAEHFHGYVDPQNIITPDMAHRLQGVRTVYIDDAEVILGNLMHLHASITAMSIAGKPWKQEGGVWIPIDQQANPHIDPQRY